MRTLFSLVVGALSMTLGAGKPAAPAPVRECASVVVREAAPAPASCVRLEGAQLGALPLSFEVLGQPVRIEEWASRDIEGTEWVGFTAELPGDVFYVVNAGHRQFASTGAKWLHPAGVVGPESKAISSVTFCKLPPQVDGCPAPVVVE
jgi:hypothetical protein